MGVSTGMRGKDLQKFLMVARQFNVILLVRHTNEDSLGYVGRSGYYPKPAAVKAKTADQNPPPQKVLVNGRSTVRTYEVSGLVVHPGFQPTCYLGAKQGKALDCWEHTMETLSPTLMGRRVDLAKPETWAIWGVERKGVLAPRFSWRVDVDPASRHFGCLQLRTDQMGWSYVHGDYDLKDVIVLGQESDNRRAEGKLDGVKNFTPLLFNRDFELIRNALNALMGVEMVQHGAEAQFAWHGDEPITVAFPTFTHLLLYDAVTVQGWYQKLNREVLAKTGLNYQQDAKRIFVLAPDGLRRLSDGT